MSPRRKFFSLTQEKQIALPLPDTPGMLKENSTSSVQPKVVKAPCLKSVPPAQIKPRVLE